MNLAVESEKSAAHKLTVLNMQTRPGCLVTGNKKVYHLTKVGKYAPPWIQTRALKPDTIHARRIYHRVPMDSNEGLVAFSSSESFECRTVYFLFVFSSRVLKNVSINCVHHLRLAT